MCMFEKAKQRPDRDYQMENLSTPRCFFRNPGENIDGTGSVTEWCNMISVLIILKSTFKTPVERKNDV